MSRMFFLIDGSTSRSGGGLLVLKNVGLALKDEKVRIIVPKDFDDKKVFGGARNVDFCVFSRVRFKNPLAAVAHANFLIFLEGLVRFCRGERICLFSLGATSFNIWGRTVAVFQNCLLFESSLINDFAFLCRLKFKVLTVVQWFSAKLCDDAIFLSRHGRDQATRFWGFSPKSSRVIYLAADECFGRLGAKEAKRRAADYKGQLRVGYITSENPYKNNELFVKAVETFARESARKVTGVLVGVSSEYGRTLFRSISSSTSEINALFEFKKFDSSSEVCDVAKTVDLWLFLSSVENCPISLIECIETSKPVIVNHNLKVAFEIGGARVIGCPLDQDMLSVAIRDVDHDCAWRKGDFPLEGRTWDHFSMEINALALKNGRLT